jgi:hypothetical protein
LQFISVVVTAFKKKTLKGNMFLQIVKIQTSKGGGVINHGCRYLKQFCVALEAEVLTTLLLDRAIRIGALSAIWLHEELYVQFNMSFLSIRNYIKI